MPPPASPSTPAVSVRREAYDAPAARWAVERAEEELVARYGMLDGGELGLTPAMFEPPDGAFLLARTDGAPDPVGCAGVHTVTAGTGEVRRVWVDTRWRRRGIARALMDGIEDAARALGLTTLELATGDRQPEAISLYDASGWDRVGVDRYEGEAATVCVYRFVKTIG